MSFLIRLVRISFLFFVTTYAMGSIIFYEPLSGRKPPGSSRKIEPKLVKYVERFEEIWGKKISFPVVFNELPERTAGRCTRWIFGDRIVEIDYLQYLLMSDEKTELLIFHELGHCALNRFAHEDGKIKFKGEKYSVPKSIMNTYLFDYYEMKMYVKYKDYYIKELFGRLNEKK